MRAYRRYSQTRIGFGEGKRQAGKLLRVTTKLHPDGQVGDNQMKEGVQKRGGTFRKEMPNIPGSNKSSWMAGP